MSHLVGNSEDRFSHNEAHLLPVNQGKKKRCCMTKPRKLSEHLKDSDQPGFYAVLTTLLYKALGLIKLMSAQQRLNAKSKS